MEVVDKIPEVDVLIVLKPSTGFNCPVCGKNRRAVSHVNCSKVLKQRGFKK